MFFFYRDFFLPDICAGVFFSFFQSNKNSLPYHNRGTVGGFALLPQKWNIKSLEWKDSKHLHSAFSFARDATEELFKRPGGMRH